MFRVLLIDDDIHELGLLDITFKDSVRFDWLPNTYYANEILDIRKYDLVLVDVNGVSLKKLSQGMVEAINHDNIWVISEVHPQIEFKNFVLKKDLPKFIAHTSKSS